MTRYYPPIRYGNALARSNARKLEAMLYDARVFPLPKIEEKRSIIKSQFLLTWAIRGGSQSTEEWIARLKADFEFTLIDKTASDETQLVKLLLLGMPVRIQRPAIVYVSKPAPTLFGLNSTLAALATWAHEHTRLALCPPMSIQLYRGA